MKLTAFKSTSPTYRKINQICESRFGVSINFNNLKVADALKLTRKIDETINQIKFSSKIHTSQNDPRYLELLMVREGLTSFIRTKRKLVEDEMGKSEVILASKDMVDSLQDMVEKLGKMQNEQLPALVDSIRNQLGTQQSDSYKTQASQVLSQLLQSVTQAREQLDTSVRSLAGEQIEQPMQDMGSAMNAGAELPHEMPDEELGGEELGDEEMGNAASGRELR